MTTNSTSVGHEEEGASRDDDGGSISLPSVTFGVSISPPSETLGGRTGASLAEEEVFRLHACEAEVKLAQSPLVERLAGFFDVLPDDSILRLRSALDASLMFRKDGTMSDLRTIVFENVSEADQKRILRRIQVACCMPPREQRGFVLLSDVDDTILPGGDMLHIAGSDRSWHTDGRLYPGVSRLHSELRGGLRDVYGGDYSVLLTARPPSFVKTLHHKFKRLTGLQNPRMAILPGQGGFVNMTKNVMRTLKGNYTNLGVTKLRRAIEYSSLFPEFVGRFVFIGDDGQADLLAAEEMLALTPQTAAEVLFSPTHLGKHGDLKPSNHLFAFVAMHAVHQGDDYKVPSERRDSQVLRIRTRFPALTLEESLIEPFEYTDCASRHRFFYFVNYADLATQLLAAGWLQQEQCQAIHRAVHRDRLPDLMACVKACDLRALRSGLDAWSEALEEADEVEVEIFSMCGRNLPFVVRAHVQLALPSNEATSLHLRMLRVVKNDYKWQYGESEAPCFMLHDTSTPKSSKICSDKLGSFHIPWPCDLLLKSYGRACIDVGGPNNPWGRFFLIVEDCASASRDGAMVEVSLHSPRNNIDVSQPVGELILGLQWDIPSQAAS
eukprot:TRINITY_DN36668_c0_g1_i1.p1 TRINITY_DN36668_c0_g1~~TRINITY_DN36668_c0_g1_i1.p1  ORF type:complete len:609 (+),score=96.08 TRINITY_DN36668_c0_g1_i1:64-1890(+)